jgi:hypothetical protein
LPLKTLLGALGALSILIPCFYSQPQTPHGVLKGTVRDETRKVAIGGAKVQVLNSAGLVLGTSRTGQDGTYLVSGLVVGQSVNAVYSAAGYAPDPWTRPLKISKPEIIQDVALLCDCKDTAYWKAWADGQKAWAESQNTDASVKARLLDESWSALGYIGISAEARGSAARSLVSVEPITGKFPAIIGFANTDPMVLRKAEEQLRSTLNGGIHEDLPRVSTEVSGEIAAVEIRKQKAEGKEFKYSLDKLNSTWGGETKKYTVQVIDKDSYMKGIAEGLIVQQQ